MDQTKTPLFDNPPSIRDIQITKYLIKNGQSCVSEVRDFLEQRLKEEVLYTTALKLLQVMYKKGHVKRFREGKKHVYYSIYSFDDLIFFLKNI